MRRLETPAGGLTTTMEKEARARFGPNVIAESKPVRPLTIFLTQFGSILVWVLIGASIVSGVLGDATDSAVILAIVFLNALVGFYQEYSAEKSIAELKQMTAPRAKVWRNGVLTIVAASDVVPGDLLEIEEGDLIAADARLLAVTSLACSEAALTGEAESVVKSVEPLDDPELPVGDRTNMVFMGTSVARGSGRAIVVGTAMHTELGRIAALITEAGREERTPLQARLDRFGRSLLWATLGIVTLLFGLGLFRREPIVELFMTSVSLAVAALPESLPAVATAALSLGVLRMSRRRALVRRLASVETLGSTNVICTDKTGTLTIGQMTVRELFAAGRSYHVTGVGYEPTGEIRENGVIVHVGHDPALRQMAEILVGCNNAHIERDHGAWNVVGDPTEGALLCAGLKAGGDRVSLERSFPRLRELPFDSDRRLHSIVRRFPEERQRVLTIGAPETLIGKCASIWWDEGAVRPLTKQDRERLLGENMRLAGMSLRVLGMAFRDLSAIPPDQFETIECDLVFVGLAGLYDPPRAEAKTAIAKCRAAGIRVVMITGDHPHTALAIGGELGLVGEEQSVTTGAELDRLDDEALRRRVPEVAVYARVNAAHKLRIVKAWQINTAVVAMTGDGVNDAPAIKGADIGVAMGRSGSEVTKQASDMIVLDDNFATIVNAVEEGRGIYENIRKTLLYLLSCNASELLLMTVCIVGGLAAPLLPIHLLWINLVTDGPPALCLAADPVDPKIMDQRPRHRSEHFADEEFLWTMALVAALITSVSLGAYLYGLYAGDLTLARTYAFSELIFAQLLAAFGARNATAPIWRLNMLSNVGLALVALASISIQIWLQHTELFTSVTKTAHISLKESLSLLAIASLPLMTLEIAKSLAEPIESRGERGRLTIGGSETILGQPSRAISLRVATIRRITVTLLIAMVTGGGLLYWSTQPERRYITQKVETTPAPASKVLAGTIRPQKTVEVLAPLTGVAHSEACGVGEEVSRGQLCAVIRRPEAELAITRGQARLAAARAQQQRAEAGLARTKAMLDGIRKTGGGGMKRARTAYERALNRAMRAETLVAQRIAGLRAAEAAMKRGQVFAPKDGIVVSRGFQTKQTVEAGKSIMLTIADANMEIEARAPQALDKIKVGDTASVESRAQPGRRFGAHVTQIDTDRSVVVLRGPRPDPPLEAGAAVIARITLDGHADLMRAPNEALRYARSHGMGETDGRSGGAFLWVLRKAKPTRVPVRLGRDDGVYTEVVEGDLEPGDELIVGERTDARED